MQFFQWETDYDLYRKQFSKVDQKPFLQFFDMRFKEQKAAGCPTVRLVAERFWIEAGSPYYNIHPQLTSKLCRVNLSKIPSTLFQMPHGLKTVHIRFAKQHDEFTIKEDQAVVSKPEGITNIKIPAGSFLHGVLMHETVAYDHRMILFTLDFNKFTPDGQPIYNVFQIVLAENESMQNCIDGAVSKYRSQSFKDMIDNVLRLCVSIGFLSTNPTICEADVLASDRAMFDYSSDEKREVIAARARRRGKHGYNIGTDLMFLGARPTTSRPKGAATGRELEYAHIRGGHPQAVRYGDGKKLVKIMWYSPNVIRPDLPFDVE